MSLVECVFPGLECIVKDLTVVVSLESCALAVKQELLAPMAPRLRELTLVAFISELSNGILLVDGCYAVALQGLETTSCTDDDIETFKLVAEERHRRLLDGRGEPLVEDCSLGVPFTNPAEVLFKNTGIPPELAVLTPFIEASDCKVHLPRNNEVFLQLLKELDSEDLLLPGEEPNRYTL